MRSVLSILSYGAYLPRYRLTSEAVHLAIGSGGGKRQRTVANHDEDSLTMAVATSQEALNSPAVADIQTAPSAVYFASCSQPYAEKQGSTLLSGVLGLPEETFSADIGASLRGATAAIRMASQAEDRMVMVAAADCRAAQQGSILEMQLGDGAGSLLLGLGEGLASIEGVLSFSTEFTDTWRLDGEKAIRQGEEGFTASYGYVQMVSNSLMKALERWGIRESDRPLIALVGTSASQMAQVQQRIPLPKSCLVVDRLLPKVGYTGNAHAILMLIDALEQAGPNRPVILVNYGSGNCDVILWRTSSANQSTYGRDTIGSQLEAGVSLDYFRFMAIKGHLPTESTDPFSSLAMDFREFGQNIRLESSCCQDCGRRSYPPRRICLGCGSVDRQEKLRLGLDGNVYTFTRDHLFPSVEGITVMAVIDLLGGGRFYTQLTDCNPTDVQIGLPVRLTFRRFHTGGGYVNYFWKARPKGDAPKREGKSHVE